ncbi:MAG: response regulator [Candidatus Scalindua sp.]|jgi:CheY-like chemotaxis protein|nr:response regulator [Candidatus Scalindua sp.]MBT6050381.1 response regulator [Candidatus Scalindua sp.]MBT6226788.1 response regulator [Candidatus Scalindua sp.]MBT6561086.1 response regulator [Candidatus Scalindua sp.]MBT7212576.1 response regulator [Candidatus Scalindua sp.]
MRILIIEDDTNKMRRIANEVRKIRKNVHLTEVRSYQNGVRSLMSDQFDFLLLDMSLPIFDISTEEDGFQVDPFSGRNILAEMNRKNVLVPTVVITMFETFGEGSDLMTLEELDKELSEKYPLIYRGKIYYNSSEINWKEALKKLFEEIT